MQNDLQAIQEHGFNIETTATFSGINLRNVTEGNASAMNKQTVLIDDDSDDDSDDDEDDDDEDLRGDLIVKIFRQ